MKHKIFLLAAMLLMNWSILAEKVKVGDLYYNLDETNQRAEVTYKSYSAKDAKYNLNWDITSASIPTAITYNDISYTVTSIGENAFQDTHLTSVEISSSVTSIGYRSFMDCSNLLSITIGNNVTSIGGGAFYRCVGLTSIVIPRSVTSIGGDAFNGCIGLTSISIDNSETNIYSSAFYGCTGLTYIEIPNSVKFIEEKAFANCSNLDSVYIGSNITSIGADAFLNCTNLTTITYNAKNCRNLAIIGYNSDGKPIEYSPSSFCGSDDCNICFGGCPNINTFIFGDSVETIPQYLCQSLSSLNSIRLGENVKNIDKYAFSQCSGLTSVTIGKSVTTIGNYAFRNCDNISTINYTGGIEDWCNNNWSPSVLSKNYQLKFNDVLQENVIIPNSVTSIKGTAFYGCNSLASVTIPNSVTTIGNYAFSGCNSLTSVEWNAKRGELSSNVFPVVLDSFAFGNDCDTINANNIKYISAKEIIIRNPMAVITNIPYAVIESNLYDTKGVGEMNAIISNLKYNTIDVLVNNLYGITVDTLLTDITAHDASEIWNACNINNDSIIDLHLDGIIYESNENGGYNQHDLSFIAPGKYAGAPRKYNHIFQLDANLDGLQDFYIYEDNKHYFQLRQWDGSYLKSELNILTDTAAIDSAIYQKWETYSDEVVFICNTWEEIDIRNGMFIGNSSEPTDHNSTGFDFIDMAIDIDRNGLVDLLSSTTGAVLYNLGDNTYVKGSFPGSVTPKDLNGDGILDYVIYNKSTKTVSLQIYEGNGTTTNKTLMQNLNITNVWCYDFDNDGDVDILLPFDWNSTSGYAFLVFWRNDGNNTFKKIENAFDDPVLQLEFLDCRDVDNDGKYEIIARETLNPGTWEYNSNYYLIRYNNRFKVTIDNPFASGQSRYLDERLFVDGDFDQNGINDFYYNTNSTTSYTLAHFPYTAINTPPAKMSQPRINVNADKAMLSIDWDRGSDTQTSSLDLEYSIRIGSKPGTCDMWFAAANADGKQRGLWGANVGAYLNQMVNVSTWKEGDYYVAVQAIDPNGLGGEWSDEVVYHHSSLPFGFNISNHNITTADTIIVQYAGDIDESNTYNWDFGDGAVILSKHEQTYTIVYTTQGNKHISMQITSSDGRKSQLVTQEVNVLPISIVKNVNYPDDDDKYLVLSYFDMDMDGVLDGIGYKTNVYGSWKTADGFYKGRGDGSFIKLAKTFNSDLTVTGPIGGCIFADVNMDGLPDIVTQTSKGSVMYNMEDFDVEFSNDTYTLPSTPAPQYDFNNDGMADSYSVKNKHTILLLLNTGTGIDTVEVYLPSEFELNELESKYLKVGYDFDNNGHLDFISTEQSGHVTADHVDAFIIYLHDDFSVTCQYINGSMYNEIYSLNTYPFADLNDDGVPDLTEYILTSNIPNEAPAVPTNLRAVQESDGVYLYWDAAKDKETPAAQMRYNISVKKKGVAVGTDNAFVISPMNGLYDEAAIIPGYYYPHGTSYFIPIDKLTGGQTYEFQIQSIDLWNAHSPMSATYTFTVQPQVLISMPAQTCMNEPVTVAYTGTNNGGISWNFDGGVASQNTDGSYSVYWATDGVKTVKATLSGNTSSKTIYVQNAQKDLTFALPAGVLNNSCTEVTLPANYEKLEHLAIRTSNNCTGYVLPKRNSRIFQVRFQSASNNDSEIGWVEFYQNDSVCGEVNTFRASTQILGMSSAPAISLVMVDATTDKYMVTWDTPANLPEYIDSVVIYKEEGKTNNWVMQAKVPVSNGQWIDQASDPSVKSYAYCIAYTSIYGGESPKSAAHKTPHLQTNYGLNGAINLYWTFYQGDAVDSYQVLRGSSSTNMQVLATVAGGECTYTDRSPIEGAYYAIAYSNEAFTNKWESGSATTNAPIRKAKKNRTGQSNIMASSASIQATLATQMTILSMEKAYTLSPSRTALHLYVEITPSHATYKQVRWQIVNGQELATVYSNGLIVVNTEGKDGTVRVRATALDGSGVYAERDITVSGMTPVITYYTIRFLNYDGTELQSSQVEEGEMPVYTEVTPTRTADEYYTYTFKGWSPTIVAATANADYTAQFTATEKPITPTYPVTILSGNENMGSTTGSGQYKQGSSVVITAVPNEGYHFSCWDDGLVPNNSITVAEACNIASALSSNRATNEQYTVVGYITGAYGNYTNSYYMADTPNEQGQFVVYKANVSAAIGDHVMVTGRLKNYRGTTPETAEGAILQPYPEYGTNATRTILVDRDTTITAIFAPNKYTITFKNDDGNVLRSDEWEYGTMPFCEEPAKASDEQYSYTFAGWMPEIEIVTGDATYTATFTTNPINPTDIQETFLQLQPIKVILNNHVYILRGDKVYTITGQEVK